MWEPWLIGLGVLIGVLVCAGIYNWRRRRTSKVRVLPIEEAKRRFHLRREWLEAYFFSLASVSGKPRGLNWIDCDFDDDVSFARDRVTGQLRAFSAVTIRFSAVEGGGMEGNENVSRLRAATSVFLLEGEEWITQGRAIFNLSPNEAIQHFREELEVVE